MIAPGTRVAFLGDSISDPEVTMGQWCDMLCTFGGWTRVNGTGPTRAAVAGSRLPDLLTQWDTRTAGADALVVCAGMNDLPAPDTTAERWAAWVRQALDLCVARRLAVLWVGIPRRVLTNVVMDQLVLDGLSHRACRAAGVPFVSLMPQMTAALVSADGVHPTFEGQQFMAGRAIDVLTEAGA